MDRHRHRGRRLLLAALLAAGVSTGLGARAAQPARAMAPASVWPPHWRQSAGEAPGPALSATATVTGVTWTQQAELTSTAQTPNDGYGSAVALSGNTAVVGAHDTPPWPSPAYGAVYIFTRTTSGVWRPQAELLDPQYGSGHDDKFGYAVALQGNLLVVGAVGATGAFTYTGAAYVYLRVGSVWHLQAMLTARDAAYNDAFGNAVALSGGTIAVGDAGKNNGDGAVYLFSFNGARWTQQAELRYPGRYAFAQFGHTVALWGTTLLVSGPGAPVVFGYARSGPTWRLQSLLSAPHSALTFFGSTLALWGNTALVGVCCSIYTPGTVDVFTRRGTTWSLQTTLTSPTPLNASLFGVGLALSGYTALIGGYGDFVYVGSGATWTLQAQLIPSDRPPTDLQAYVALQGNTALVGATNVNGTAFVFVRSGAGWATTDTAEARASA